jgi:hypothetical protein
MAYFYPAIGAAVAVAGTDKLAGNRAYAGLFRHLGWSHNEMRAAAVAEVAGGLLMAQRSTRRIGGAMVAVSSAAVLAGEVRKSDGKLAAARGLVLLAGLLALVAP